MIQIRGHTQAEEFVLNNKNTFFPALIIPVYNHENAIGITLSEALKFNVPVLLVDDGSDVECREVLISLAEKHSNVVMLIHLNKNAGKGAAVRAGLKKLNELGYSHAIQIDADGQHDLADLPKFIGTSRTHPASLITGEPEFDDSIPKSRYYSRYLTHVWVWINTLSFKIKDTMCGFRVYPLAEIVMMLEDEPCGDRMSFDTEVLVRWFWRGGEIINVSTVVRYPIDGVSHFDVWQDNINITKMHTQLFFGMLRRLPVLIGRKFHG